MKFSSHFLSTIWFCSRSFQSTNCKPVYSSYSHFTMLFLLKKHKSYPDVYNLSMCNYVYYHFIIISYYLSFFDANTRMLQKESSDGYRKKNITEKSTRKTTRNACYRDESWVVSDLALSRFALRDIATNNMLVCGVNICVIMLRMLRVYMLNGRAKRAREGKKERS